MSYAIRKFMIGAMSNAHDPCVPSAAHLRAGTEDVYGLNGVAAQFGSFLTEHGLPASVVLEPGGHDWSYWRRAILPLLQWHGRLFAYD